jgi:hypothetical protein
VGGRDEGRMSSFRKHQNFINIEIEIADAKTLALPWGR